MAAKALKSFLSALTQLTKQQLKVTLSKLQRKHIVALREIVVNALQGNIKLDSSTLKRLLPYKKFLRQFAKRGVKKCILSKRCNAIFILLKAAKEAIDTL